MTLIRRILFQLPLLVPSINRGIRRKAIDINHLSHHPPSSYLYSKNTIFFERQITKSMTMKQKVVLEVDMHDAKSRSKAMKIAVGLPGVISATIEPDKNQLTVVGDGLDSVYLTTLLRKRMSSKIERLFCLSIVSSELVSVTPVDEKKKEEEKKPEPIVAWPFQYYPTVAQPHFLYEAPYSRNDNCSIM